VRDEDELGKEGEELEKEEEE